MAATKPTTINAYLKPFPKEVRDKLQQIRAAIQKAAPKATEAISYGIPAFKLNGTYLIYFAGYKGHVSIYPTPAGDADLRKQLAPYHVSRGTLRFALDKPLPMPLIRKVIKAKIAENKARAAK
jgi:uncharacterized protein YdhG (YjbR/CyaY superfamily)